MKIVVTHPDQGIYVGDSYGHSLWSRIDAAGRDTVAAFGSPDEARTCLSAYDDLGDVETDGYEYQQVTAESGADYATIEELKAAGLGFLLGNMDKAPWLGEKPEPWELTFDEFTGPAMIGEAFATAGRDMEEYDWLWSTASDLNNLGEPAWSGEGGYTVRELLDCDPPGTFALLTPEDRPCGFYMDSGLWIDPEHRGKGLSSRLILAAASFHGGSPTNNTEGLGFSAAGYGAHRKAHSLAVHKAVEVGLPVPGRVLEEYGIEPEAEPDALGMAPGMR